jgi:hypothetical protein
MRGGGGRRRVMQLHLRCLQVVGVCYLCMCMSAGGLGSTWGGYVCTGEVWVSWDLLCGIQVPVSSAGGVWV